MKNSSDGILQKTVTAVVTCALVHSVFGHSGRDFAELEVVSWHSGEVRLLDSTRYLRTVWSKHGLSCTSTQKTVMNNCLRLLETNPALHIHGYV